MRIASLLRQVARRPLVAVAQQPRIVGSARLSLTLARSFEHQHQHWDNNDNGIRRFSTSVAAIEEPARVRFAFHPTCALS